MAGTRRPKKPRKGGGTQSGGMTIPPRGAATPGSSDNPSLVRALSQQFQQASKEDTPNLGEILYRVAIEATRGEASAGLATYQQALDASGADKKASLLRAADAIAAAGGDDIVPSAVFAQEVIPGRQDITNDLAAQVIDTARAQTKIDASREGRGSVTSRERAPAPADTPTTTATPDPTDAIAKLRRANRVFEEYTAKLDAALEGGMSQDQFDLTPAAQRLQRRLRDAVEGDLDLLDYLDMRLDEQPAPSGAASLPTSRSDFGTGLSPGAYDMAAIEGRRKADRSPEDAMFAMFGPWGQAAQRMNTLIPMLNERLAGSGTQFVMRPDNAPQLAGARNQTISGVQPRAINALREQIANFQSLPIQEGVGRLDHVLEQGMPITKWVWDNVLTEEARAEIRGIQNELRANGQLPDIAGTDLFDDESAPAKPQVIAPVVLSELSPEVREQLLVRRALQTPEFAEGGPTAFGSEADREQSISFVQRQLDETLRRQQANIANRASGSRQSNAALAARAEQINQLMSGLRPQIEQLALGRTSLSPATPTAQINLDSKLNSLVAGLRDSGVQGDIPIAIPSEFTVPGRRGSTLTFSPKGSDSGQYSPRMSMENRMIREQTSSTYDKLIEDVRRLIYPQADAYTGQAADPNWSRRTEFDLSMRMPQAFRRYGVYLDPFSNPQRPFGGLAFGDSPGTLPPEVFGVLTANNAALDPVAEADFRRAFIDFLTRQASEQLPAGPVGIRAQREYGMVPMPGGQYRQPTMIGSTGITAIQNLLRQRGLTDALKEFNEGVGKFRSDLDAGVYNPASPAYRAPAVESVDPYAAPPQPLDVQVAPPNPTDSADPYSMGYVRPDAMFVKPSYRIPLLRNLVA